MPRMNGKRRERPSQTPKAVKASLTKRSSGNLRPNHYHYFIPSFLTSVPMTSVPDKIISIQCLSQFALACCRAIKANGASMEWNNSCY